MNPFDKKRSFFPDWCKRKLASVENRVVVLTTAVPFVKVLLRLLLHVRF